MNASEYARKRGVSRQAISQAIKHGRLTREADGQIDPEKADRELGGASRAAVSAGVPNYGTSRAVREAYRAKRELLDYEERAGRLVTIEDVEGILAGLVSTMRTNLLGIGPAIAPVVALETDPRRCQDLIDRRVREVLEEFAGGVRDVASGQA